MLSARKRILAQRLTTVIAKLIHAQKENQISMKYYQNKYFNDLTVWPLGIFYGEGTKLPLRVRFALWLFGFKKCKDARKK